MRDTVYFEFHSNGEVTGYVMSLPFDQYREIKRTSQEVEGFEVCLTPTPGVYYKWGENKHLEEDRDE